MTAKPTKPSAAKKPAQETSLVLRVCRKDGSSYRGFKWPLEAGATVSAPDWKNNDECGNGLHGWLYGQGDHSCVDFWQDGDAQWLVLEVVSETIVMLSEKCKFPTAKVRFVGARTEAAAYMIANEPRAANVAVIGAHMIAPDGGVAQAGALSTLTGGHRSTLTGGYGSTLTGGDGSTLTGGEGSTLTGGYGSTLTGGHRSTLTGGYGSTLTGGYGSTLTGGDGSTLTGGEGSELRIRWHNGKRYRTSIAYAGEDGIKANVAYRLNEKGEFVKVQP